MNTDPNDRRRRKTLVLIEQCTTERLPPADSLSFEEGTIVNAGEELLTRCHYICALLDRKLRQVIDTENSDSPSAEVH
jgi:hypothetical protein